MQQGTASDIRIPDGEELPRAGRHGNCYAEWTRYGAESGFTC